MIGNVGTMRLQTTDSNGSFLIFFFYRLRFACWDVGKLKSIWWDLI